MNQTRRKTIQAIIKQLDDLEELRTSIEESIQTIKDEEEEYLNNIPENMQTSERYEKAEAAVENLESALDTICIDFEDIKTDLENAAE